MYRLVVERRAEKDLTGWPSPSIKRIAQALRDLTTDPYPPGSLKLSGQGENLRIRVGDYRIIYRVSETPPEIRILKIGHRKDVYR